MSCRQIGKLPDEIIQICKRLQAAGGHSYLVGGCVRDLLLGGHPKDFDLEVYGLGKHELEELLSGIGRSESVGKSFGVIKLWLNELEVDVALPRCEYKIMPGHRGFEVKFDPNMDPREASRRRDFTINAMMFDPISRRLLDHHGGRHDLQTGRLRHVSPAFSEDPLRVLRGMQFAARFRLKLDKETALLCKKMLDEAKNLAIERIWQEWWKWAMAPYPSYGLRMLRESGWLAIYPEIEALIGCPQEPRWHPEGDVWNHTCLVVDNAARISTRYGWHGERRLAFVFAALCHDFGKPITTLKDSAGHIRSPEHCQEGLLPAASFLKRIGAPQYLWPLIEPLIREHITHMHGEATPRAVRRLAHRLEPADIELWEALVEADASGRSPHPPCRPALPWLEQARKMASERGKPKPIVGGDMLIRLGVKPGPEMGKIIAEAYEAQLDGKIHDDASAEAWCREHLDNL
jgi:tRNA nucleotidyltransferase (CCA-adding enzyme)